MFDNHTIAGKSNHLSLNHLRYLSSSFSLDALLQSRLSYFPNREENAYGRAVQPIHLIDLLPLCFSCTTYAFSMTILIAHIRMLLPERYLIILNSNRGLGT